MKKGLLFIVMLAIGAVEMQAQTSKMREMYSRSKLSGYRGFFDAGYSFGAGDYGANRMDISTSHGYQISPYLFAGAGVGFNWYHESRKAYGVPIFAHLRTEMPRKRYNPFVEMKIGYSAADVDGFYIAPAVGVRFNQRNRMGVNVSVGYSTVKTDVNYRFMDFTGTLSNVNCGAVTLKVGVDW